MTKTRALFAFVLPSVLALLLVACGTGGTDDCNDGADNDSDGLIDLEDPGCKENGNKESPDPDYGACGDAVDNDGDGLIDTEDPGCADLFDEDEYNEPIAGCKDGIDNDGDGLVDFPNDPGCDLTLQDSEEDSCPDGATCPACSNGQDDDADGFIDYPDDLGCNSAADNEEFNADPSICGANVSIQPLPANGLVMGQILGTSANELISPDCGGSGQEAVYVINPTAPIALTASTNFPETNMDTVLYVRSDCRDPDTELACNDDDGLNVSSLSIDRLEPGTYYIVVDSHSASAVGSYRLQVNLSIPQGEECTVGGDPCAPGLVCRLFNGAASTETCEQPECNDGQDNGDSEDSLVDYPSDPGCDSPTDNDEADDCPSGPNCPQCSNDQDDDNDLLSDYGSDPGCTAASDDNEIDECIPGVEVIPLDGAGATGTTSGSSNFTPSCSFSTTAPEDIYAYMLTRNVQSLSFSTIGSGFDTVLSVRYDDCDSSGAELVCSDPAGGGERVTLDNPSQGNYYVFVDGAFGAGSYTLSVEAVLPPNAACDPNEAGVVCTSGYTCRTNTCVVARCNDGVNNADGDSLIDFPNDPGCTSPSDDSEPDDCPNGPNCPACGNDTDDDGDTEIDYPDDPGCTSAADNLELDECIPGVTVVELTDTGAAGTTPLAAEGSDFTPSCHTSTSSTEVVYAYRNTRNLTQLSFSSIGSAGDTVLSVRENDCGSAAAEEGCENVQNGGETVTVSNPTQNFFYFVFVDGDFVSNIDYVLNVSGRIGAGQTCVQGNTQFTCIDGYRCGGANTCIRTACNNLSDNDADGLVDFPNDPGCTDINDNSEGDTCPGGATCPQCGNNQDDDGDGRIDFDGNGGMADMGCEFAADNLELDDCIAGVPLLELTDSGATGTTEPTNNSDFTPSCHTSTNSSEDEYAYYNSRDLTSLTFSTVGSTGDSVLYVRYGTCGNVSDEIACLNTQNGGESVTISNPVDDDYYYVFVDGDFVSDMSYVLNVSGTLGDGQACSVADTQFVCDAALGFTCVSNTCQPSNCVDGVDNDGDGETDLFDPGCASRADNTESPDPSPDPQCADGMDNDGDGETDYPDDVGCEMASDNDEMSCDDTDPVLSVTMPVTTGTTTGATNDWTGATCGTSSTSPDKAHELIVPGQLSSLSVDTNGSAYDTVLYIKEGECSNMADVACDDDGGNGTQSLINLTNVPAGVYYLIVDGFSSAGTSFGNYTLNVTGVISSGAACNPTQITAGIFTCATGTTCTGGICQ